MKDKRYLISLFKSFVIGAFLVISILSTFPDNLYGERTPYCEEALKRCINSCDQIFNYPLNQAYHIGCYIGLQHCFN